MLKFTAVTVPSGKYIFALSQLFFMWIIITYIFKSAFQAGKIFHIFTGSKYLIFFFFKSIFKTQMRYESLTKLSLQQPGTSLQKQYQSLSFMIREKISVCSKFLFDNSEVMVLTLTLFIDLNEKTFEQTILQSYFLVRNFDQCLII